MAIYCGCYFLLYYAWLDRRCSDKHQPTGQFLPANQPHPGGLKGRGALDEPRRHKHCTPLAAEARSESRKSRAPRAFSVLISTVIPYLNTIAGSQDILH